MKTKILFLSLFLAYAGLTNAQITLQHVYSTDTPDRSVKLALSGLKYVHVHKIGPDLTYFTLYNPDHTNFKTLNIPAWTGRTANNIRFVSETLFDLDTLVEYAVNYTDGITNALRICNENGIVLLERDTANTAGSSVSIDDDGFITAGIFPDGNSTKLMVIKGNFSGSWSFSEEIYSLPGQLACLECSNSVISGLTQQPSSSQSNKSIAYPNPFTNGVKIKYILPENCKHASINIYDFAGKLIKKKEIDNNFTEVYISNDEIKQGAYFYQVVADDKVISGNKMIKI
jgi:hypothetical protein